MKLTLAKLGHLTLGVFLVLTGAIIVAEWDVSADLLGWLALVSGVLVTLGVFIRKGYVLGRKKS